MKSIQVLSIALVALSLLVTHSYAQNKFPKTPSDMEGPFYPVERRSDEDNNLIQVKNTSQSATGDVLNLTGIVLTTEGVPQKDIIVEIWQADPNGLYQHPRDRSPGKRDPFFQYWGKARTDSEGKYRFTTLVPGEYEPRPPHIHFKVWADDKVILTSQMYISDSKTNPYSIHEALQLELVKKDTGEYAGFFRIVF